jgi:anti-sigma factor RsiW
MNCRDVQEHLREYQQGRLGAGLQSDLRAHIEGCTACAQAAEVERALTEVLEQRLPQYPASLTLKRRLTAQWPSAPPPRATWWTRWGRSLVPAVAVAAVLLVALPFYYQGVSGGRATGASSIVNEAVNDHLRVLSSQRPLEVESGSGHHVRPWFAGRLDFAPRVPDIDDPGFSLRGGAVGYFLDRKAAIFVYGRGLHTISLFVFPVEGLPWPAHSTERLGNLQIYRAVSRGFTVILWRNGELGYALVSDVPAPELLPLAEKLTAGP